jgi:CDP-glycerol glycerophosphotransferase
MKKRIKKILRSIRNGILCALFYLFRVFPVRNNKIFFQNFNGKGYGDNPKYIVEELLRRSSGYDLVWAVDPKYSAHFPPTVRTVAYRSPRASYEEATAKIWIDNCRKQPYVRKRKNQYYIQTWHDGCIPLKKMEKDVEAMLDPYYVRHAKHDSTLIDLLLSNSTCYTAFYRSSFWYRGEIMECGSPRDDLFFIKEEKQRVKEKVFDFFSLPKDLKLLLYAPTFRDTFDTDVFDVDYQAVISRMKQETKQNWVFLVRLHPGIAEKARYIAYSGTVINASNYNDVQELLLACDMLISDYSGVIIEFALMKKPVFLYAKDLDSYNRQFYTALSDLPFPIAKDMPSLLKNMTEFDSQGYIDALTMFFARFGIFEDGCASKRVVDRIERICSYEIFPYNGHVRSKR